MRHPRFIVALVLLSACGAPAVPNDRATSVDDVEIAYSASGAGSPALVFVHGWTLDRGYWDPQVAHFSRTHRIVTVDLAGHGESGTTRQNWTIANFGHDVASVVNDAGLEDAILIGHSMGGSVVLEAARLLGDKLAGIVFVDAFHDPDQIMSDEEREGILQAYRSDFRGNVASMVQQYLFSPQTDSVLASRITEQMSTFDPAIGLASIENLFLYDSREALPHIAVPMAAINAEQYPTNLESMLRYGITVQIISGVGHFPMVEKPKEFNEILQETISSWN